MASVTEQASSDSDNISSSYEELRELSEELFVRTASPQGYAFEPVQDSLQLSANSSDTTENSEPSSPEPDRPDRRQSLFWCNCGNCMLMPTQEVCVCCAEVRQIQHRIPDGQGPMCIRDNPTYSYVTMDREVLDVSLLLMQDVRASSLTRPIDSRYSYECIEYLSPY